MVSRGADVRGPLKSVGSMESARIAMNVLSGTAPGGAVTEMRFGSSLENVPPSVGVKTA